MTIVEFFDSASTNNIVGALLCRPDRIIFVGNERNKIKRARELYEKILGEKGIETMIIEKSINRNDINEVVKGLSKIIDSIDKEEPIIFDVTGGDDLYLVGVGIILNKYQGRIQCHRFNFGTERLYDCDGDKKTCEIPSFDISIDDNIKIYGGEIITDPKDQKSTYPWLYDSGFEADVEKMWAICKEKVGLWNAQINIIGEICKNFDMADENELKIQFDLNRVKSEIKPNGRECYIDTKFLTKLSYSSLIRNLSINERQISFEFKNRQIKKALTVAGQVLELWVAQKMRSIKDKDNKPMYHDVRVGVVIDWDQNNSGSKYRTINEIDVMAMKGAVPIFISCKNGDFDSEELFKLNTVAEHFGSKYAKKVLISTRLDEIEESKAQNLRARMIDIGINNIENVDSMEEKTFEARLKELMNN